MAAESKKITGEKKLLGKNPKGVHRVSSSEYRSERKSCGKNSFIPSLFRPGSVETKRGPSKVKHKNQNAGKRVQLIYPRKMGGFLLLYAPDIRCSNLGFDFFKNGKQ